MKYLKLYKHLLPRGRAWSLIADKPLRRFFLGLALVWEAVEQYLGEIYFDLFVGSTRALDEWDEQFGFTQKIGTDSRLARLSAAWKASGGQSPRYIQDTLQAAGFDVYVHEWWEPEALPLVGFDGGNLVRSPLDPSAWNGASDSDGVLSVLAGYSPAGVGTFGQFEFVGGLNNVFAPFLSTLSATGDAGSFWTAFAVRDGAGAGNGVESRLRTIAGAVESITYRLDNGASNAPGRVTSINALQGWRVVVIEHEYAGGDPVKVELYWRGVSEDGGTLSPPQVGARIDMQAAYFARASENPVTYPAPNPKYTPPPALTPRNPLLLLADDSQDVVYYVEAGEPLAQAGEPLAQAGEIFGYRFRPRTYDLPTDPALWPYFLYIGGEKFGTTASVDTTRRAEFERLCLKICPLQLWLGMLVTYE